MAPDDFLAGLGPVLWGGWWAVAGFRFEPGLSRIRRLMDDHQFPEARRWLVQVGPRWANDPEIAYRLGACRRQSPGPRWRPGTALNPTPAGRAGPACARRTLVGDLGRFSDGEAILVALLRKPGSQRDEVRHTLSELYFWEGRRDTVRRLIEQSWQSAANPMIELRDHWRVETSPILLEKVRVEVDRASRLAPDDDRVWLAQASLAMQSGRFDEASFWLERCCRLRPADPDVWRARLNRKGRLEDVTQSTREPWTIPRVARGLVVGDLDNDGRADLVSLAQNSPVFFFHNQTDSGHAVMFRLEGTRSNRDGVGAVVTLTAGGRQRRAWRYGGGSFVSASDPRIHFGLGRDSIRGSRSAGRLVVSTATGRWRPTAATG